MPMQVPGAGDFRPQHVVEVFLGQLLTRPTSWITAGSMDDGRATAAGHAEPGSAPWRVSPLNRSHRRRTLGHRRQPDAVDRAPRRRRVQLSWLARRGRGGGRPWTRATPRWRDRTRRARRSRDRPQRATQAAGPRTPARPGRMSAAARRPRHRHDDFADMARLLHRAGRLRRRGRLDRRRCGSGWNMPPSSSGPSSAKSCRASAGRSTSSVSTSTPKNWMLWRNGERPSLLVGVEIAPRSSGEAAIGAQDRDALADGLAGQRIEHGYRCPRRR